MNSLFMLSFWQQDFFRLLLRPANLNYMVLLCFALLWLYHQLKEYSFNFSYTYPSGLLQYDCPCASEVSLKDKGKSNCI